MAIRSKGAMMKKLLAVTALVEASVGIPLLFAPAMLASILLGSPLDTVPGLFVARLAGAALLSLGGACWAVRRDAQSRAAAGMVIVMLIYNVATAVLLVSARFFLGMTGIGLLPASAVHVVLAGWCIACLQSARGAVVCRLGIHPERSWGQKTISRMI